MLTALSVFDFVAWLVGLVVLSGLASVLFLELLSYIVRLWVNPCLFEDKETREVDVTNG